MQKKKMGRPPKIIADERTMNTIKGCAEVHCTQEEAAAILGVHRHTFRDFLATNKKAAEVWELGLLAGKAKLRRLQMQAATAGNATMLIWLGKQLLGQRDQIMQEHKVDVNLDEVRNAIASKLARIRAAAEDRQPPRTTH